MCKDRELQMDSWLLAQWKKKESTGVGELVIKAA